SAPATSLARFNLAPGLLLPTLAATAALVPGPEGPAASAAAPPLGSLAAETPAADLHGDPLPADALARLGAGRFRPGGGVPGLFPSADGRALASLGQGQDREWDAATGKELRGLGTTKDQAAVGQKSERKFLPLWGESRAVSPDGKLLAKGDGDRTIELWDLKAK